MGNSKPRVYWLPVTVPAPHLMNGVWVSSLDHGSWTEENYWFTWQAAIDDALYMGWEVSELGS